MGGLNRRREPRKAKFGMFLRFFSVSMQADPRGPQGPVWPNGQAVPIFYQGCSIWVRRYLAVWRARGPNQGIRTMAAGGLDHRTTRVLLSFAMFLDGFPFSRPFLC